MTQQTPNPTPPQARLGLLAQLARNARLVWRLFSDPRVPIVNKLVIPAVMAAYVLWPADLLPDFIPALGQLDDLAVVALAVKLFIDFCPQEIVRQHRTQMATPKPAEPVTPNSEVVDAEYRVVE